MIRLALAIALGRIAGWVSRVVGRGATALPGLVAEKIDPTAASRLAATLPEGVVLVTGTNGKTTTTRMLVTILERSGKRVVTNRSGSNLSRGILTSMIAASRRGRLQGDLGVFEVDEAAVRAAGPALGPRLVVVTNLARDQLDRYGELDTAAAHVGKAVEASQAAVLNRDDPLVASLGVGSEQVHWYGAVGTILDAMPSDPALHGGDAPPAAVVADALLEDARQEGDGQVISVRIDGEVVSTRLQVPGAYNAYNAAAALLAAARLGVRPAEAAAAVATMPPAFGRGQVVEMDGRRVKVLLVKNPAGLNQAIRLLAAEPEPHHVLIAINDQLADGRDVSWLWDAAVEELAQGPHRFGASGQRAHDMALRFKYAGIDAWIEPDAKAALSRLVHGAAPGETVYLVPTYTAMLTFLELLLPGVPRDEAWS